MCADKDLEAIAYNMYDCLSLYNIASWTALGGQEAR